MAETRQEREAREYAEAAAAQEQFFAEMDAVGKRAFNYAFAGFALEVLKR